VNFLHDPYAVAGRLSETFSAGHSVGAAPPEEDEDFEFEQALTDIHTELAELNKEAAEPASKTQENFEELVV